MTDKEIEDLKKLWENCETIYLSKEDYDALVEKLNEPPKFDEKVARVFMKKSPWDN